MCFKSHLLYLLIILIYTNTYCCFVLNKLTTSQVEKIANWDSDNKQNIWELSGQLEGDIVIVNKPRNVLIDNRTYWPGNIIPYEVDNIFSDNEKKLIEKAAKQFEINSCFTVRPKTDTDNNYVFITGTTTGCWAYLGFQGGIQYLNLQKSACLGEGTIIHEFLHSIGFLHQHSSWNRDDHVQILWENIQEDMWYNFEKSNKSYTTNFELPYDYDSILHYSAYAFTGNGEPTIIPKVANVQIGQRIRMSDIDIAKLNKLCESSTTVGQIDTTTNEYSTTEDQISSTTVESTTQNNSGNRIDIFNYLLVNIQICFAFVTYILII